MTSPLWNHQALRQGLMKNSQAVRTENGITHQTKAIVASPFFLPDSHSLLRDVSAILAIGGDRYHWIPWHKAIASLVSVR